MLLLIYDKNRQKLHKNFKVFRKISVFVIKGGSVAGVRCRGIYTYAEGRGGGWIPHYPYGVSHRLFIFLSKLRKMKEKKEAIPRQALAYTLGLRPARVLAELFLPLNGGEECRPACLRSAPAPAQQTIRGSAMAARQRRVRYPNTDAGSASAGRASCDVSV